MPCILATGRKEVIEQSATARPGRRRSVASGSAESGHLLDRTYLCLLSRLWIQLSCYTVSLLFIQQLRASWWYIVLIVNF